MKKLLFLGLVVFALTSCKKEITELPAATDTGANTFGAIINGNLWGPANNSVIPNIAPLEGHLAVGSVYINARNFASSPNETEMEIYIKDISGPGTYTLSSNTGSYAYYVKRNLTPINEWRTNNQYTGQVNITKFDIANHIISGTFSFQAQEVSNTADPLTVTEGRFDVRLQ